MITEDRDLDFELRYKFDPKIDYIEECQRRQSILERKDRAEWIKFVTQHGGDIAFLGKLDYYKRQKRNGSL